MEFDKPLGLYTGAGTIFGVTGGVMEAAIRTGYELITKEAIPDVEVTAVRGTEGFRTSVLKVGDLNLKVGVVTGLKNVIPVLEAVKNGTLVSFHRSDDLSGGLCQRRRTAEASYGYGQRRGLCGQKSGNLCS